MSSPILRAAGVALTLGASACTVAGDVSLFPKVDAGATCDVGPLPDAVSTLFVTRCGGAGCHTGGSAGGSLALDADVALSQLVNVASASGAKTRVIPGDSANSWLVQKCNGTALPQMPLGQAALTSDELATLTDWIDALPDCGSTSDATDATDATDGTSADGTDATDGTSSDGTDATDATDGTSTDATDATDGGSDTCAVTTEISTLLTSRCAGCHTGGAKLGNYDCDPARIISTSVNVNASTGTPLIVPGDAAGSYLIMKLRGTGSGTVMPLGGALPEAEIQAFEAWINGLTGCGGGG